MRRNSRSTGGTSSLRHSSSPAPQRSNRPVIGEESDESIYFLDLGGVFQASIARIRANRTLLCTLQAWGFRREAPMKTLLMTALCSVELLTAGQPMNVAVCNLDGVREPIVAAA